MTDSHLTRDGATIAYELTGSGRPFGYAHGVMLSRDAVRRLGLFDFDALASRHRLLTYDARGHGRSTGRPAVGDYLFESFARDLLALLESLDLDEPVDFAGSSLGCDSVLRAATVAPGRFRRLVLMIPPAAWDSGGKEARQWYTDVADRIETYGAARWREEWAHAEPLPIFADYPRFDLTPDVDDALLPAIFRGVGMSDLPDPDAVAALDHPTLILTWDTDPLHPVAVAERLHELISGSELHVARSVDDITTWTRRIEEFVAD